jgi:succinate dehydrogenase/fumarate reductase cytochrome b subunit
MNATGTLTIPRNSTHQADGMLHGRIARLLNRVTGVAIVVFVMVHVIAQSVMHVPAFAGLRNAAPWLRALTTQNWIHAILLFSIVFHTLYGLRLVAGDLGIRLPYRAAWWTTLGISAVFAAREILRYAGI